MEQHPCDPPRKGTAACPLYAKTGRCFGDTHHLEFPRRDYKTSVEKQFRELDSNKVFICRALHDAIHASGYIPEKPSRSEMAQEIWQPEPSVRSTAEMMKQLDLGQQILDLNPPKDVA